MLRLCLLVLAIASQPLIGSFSQATNHPVSILNSDALRLTLRLDRKAYRISDTLNLEVRLQNVGKGDIYIWEWDMCWNPAKGLSMSVIDATGKEVEPDVLWDCVPPPPRPGTPYEFVKLAPNSFYGHIEEIKLTEIVKKPGEYDMSASFNSFLSASWVTQFLNNEPISKLPLWTMEEPTVSSKRIHFSVQP